jgi:hypothetical protein
MGTEKYWQEEKKRLEKNKDNINPIIGQTMEDARALVPARHPKTLYTDCLQGALFWNQLAQSDDLTLPGMALILCRDVGCELQYCQASMSDPYERPFEDCNQQFRHFNSCITGEQRRYTLDPQGRSLQDHLQFMLEKKKKEKYGDLLAAYKVETPKEREYIIKEQNARLPMDYETKL